MMVSMVTGTVLFSGGFYCLEMIDMAPLFTAASLDNQIYNFIDTCASIRQVSQTSHDIITF